MTITTKSRFWKYFLCFGKFKEKLFRIFPTLSFLRTTRLNSQMRVCFYKCDKKLFRRCYSQDKHFWHFYCYFVEIWGVAHSLRHYPTTCIHIIVLILQIFENKHLYACCFPSVEKQFLRNVRYYCEIRFLIGKFLINDCIISLTRESLLWNKLLISFK